MTTEATAPIKQFEDISSFYTDQRAIQEEVQWLLTRPDHKKDALFTLPRLEKYQIKSILETGCGSGILAAQIPGTILYHGIDKNSWFLQRARARCAEAGLQHSFQCWDVRTWDGPEVDLVMAWAFLKHFGLHEWDKILAKILSFGKYGCFEMQLLDNDLDNGTEYHHSFVTEKHLQAAITAAGHEILERETLWSFTLPTGEAATAVALWTKRLTTARRFGKIIESLPPGPETTATYRQYLEIDGASVPEIDLAHYTIRWADVPPTPVLYKDGKRVTQAWRINMDVSRPEDTTGANANTT